MERIVKSVLWLVGCTGLGFVLLQVTQPNEAKIAEIKKYSQSNPNQNQLLIQKIKESMQQK